MRNKSRDATRTVLLWLFLELVAAAQARGPAGERVLGMWLRATAAPIEWTATWIAHTVGDLYFGVRNIRYLINELQTMSRELELVQAENLVLREDLAALREAQRILPLANGFADTSRVARCSFRNIAQGTMHIQSVDDAAVALNTVVVSGDGIIGRVVWNNHRKCIVQLITHPAAAVAVRNNEGSVQGLLAGTGGRQLNLEYVPRNARLVRGTTLVSSGADGIYPPGFPVATVISVRESEAAFLEVAAISTAALDDVRVVLLLPEWATDQPHRAEE